MSVELDKPVADFQAQATSGQQVKLSDLKGKQVVLYFYPKDATPGCTTEGMDFSARFEQFKAANTLIFGVSMDSLKKHESFKCKQAFPFELISDEDGQLRRAYQVPSSMLGLLPGRVTYVIDREGKVAHVFNSQIQAKRHVKEALDVVKRIGT